MTSFVVILTVVAAVALGVIGVAIISADVHIARLEKRVEHLEKWAGDVGEWARDQLRAGNLSLRDEHPNAPQRAQGGPVEPVTFYMNGDQLGEPFQDDPR